MAARPQSAGVKVSLFLSKLKMKVGAVRSTPSLGPLGLGKLGSCLGSRLAARCLAAVYILAWFDLCFKEDKDENKNKKQEATQGRTTHRRQREEGGTIQHTAVPNPGRPGACTQHPGIGE